MIAFEKWHGLGNDFVVIDARDVPLPVDAPLARAVADRRTGVGCDQLILLERSSLADVRMRVFNADGSEVGACGNASRCVAAKLGRAAVIETGGGLLRTAVDGSDVTVDMGVPRFTWDRIPLAYPLDTERLPVAWDDLVDCAAVNVGNPHVVFFVPDVDAVDLARLGPLIERDPLFPERVNVNVASIEDGGLALRVWERGAGLTLACGTGACATAVAAIRRRLAASPVRVNLPGGELHVAWEAGGAVRMTGPATFVFAGRFDSAALAGGGAAGL
ncbi:MAG: Diaminopimelate epimerase [uncultured Sphingomonadaceae bacterium]|uniref:Diaminopimelate epimerase n=1 Tax=uncultured Sphingomonadaceae bacterium TaxID=169976 RepID=A0A6J4T8I9_9SPHN|nr:MAG: Diaminopimelate epimerase [uncultured Sphingomonadaceae bacterium]